MSSSTIAGSRTPPPGSMVNPGKWHYVATCLMAHMGVYTVAELNQMNWLWHFRVALRIPDAMRRHRNREIRYPNP